MKLESLKVGQIYKHRVLGFTIKIDWISYWVKTTFIDVPKTPYSNGYYKGDVDYWPIDYFLEDFELLYTVEGFEI